MPLDRRGLSHPPSSSEDDVSHFPCLAHCTRASYTAPQTRVFLDPGVYPQPSRASPCSHFLRCFRLHYPVVRLHLLAALGCSDSHWSPRTRKGAEDHASKPFDSIRENAVAQSALELQPGHHYHGNNSLPLPQAEPGERLKTQSASPLGHRECLHAKASTCLQSDRTNEDDPEILRALAAKDCSPSPVCVRCAAKNTGESLFFPGNESANALSHLVKRSIVPQGSEDPCQDTLDAFDQLALAVLKRLKKHATAAVESILNTPPYMHLRQASRTRLKRENRHNFACLRSTSAERIFRRRKPTNQQTSERPQKRKKRGQETVLATVDTTTKTEEGIPVVEEGKDAETDVTAENPTIVSRPSRPGSPLCSAQENLPAAYLLRKKRIKTSVAHVSTAIYLANGASPQQSSTRRRRNPCLWNGTGRKLERVETEIVSNSADGRNDREMDEPLSGADENVAEKENKLRVESVMRSTPVSYRSNSSPYEAGDIEEGIPEISFSSSEDEFLACSIDSPSSLHSPSTSSLSSSAPCIFSEPCSPLFSSSPMSSGAFKQKPCFSPHPSSSSASLCLAEPSPVPVVSRKGALDLPPSASLRQVQTACTCTCLSACLSSDSLPSERPLASGRSSLIAALRFALRLLFNSDRYPLDFFSGASHSVARLALHLTFLTKRMQELRPRVSCGSSTTEAPLVSALAGSVARPEEGEQRLWRKRVVEKREETQRQRTRKTVRDRGKSASCDSCQGSVHQRIPHIGDSYGQRRKADEHTEDRQRNGTYTQWLKEASGGVKRPRALINENEATPKCTSAMNSEIEEERQRKKQEVLRARKTNFSLALKLQCLKTSQRQSRPPGKKTESLHQMRLSPNSSYSFSPTSCSLAPSSAAVCAASPVSSLHLPPTLSSSRIAAAAVSPQRPKKYQQHVSFSRSYPRDFASVSPQSPSAFSEGCRAHLSAPDISGAGRGAPVSPDAHTLAEGSPRFRSHAETLGEAVVDAFLKRHDRFRLGRLTQEERALLRLLIQSSRLICLLLRALLSPTSFSEQGCPHVDTSSQCSSTSSSSFRFQQSAWDALADAEPPSSFLVRSLPVAPRRHFRYRRPFRSPSSSSLSSPPLPVFSSCPPSPRSPPCPPPCSPSSSVSSPSSSTASSSSSPSSSSSASLEREESAQRARESRLQSAVFAGPQTLIQAVQMYFAYRPGAGRHLLDLLPACIVAEEDRVVFQPLSWRVEEKDTFGLSPREQAPRNESNRHDVEVASGDSDTKSREKEADERDKKRKEKRRRGTRVERGSETTEEDEGDRDGKDESGEGSERDAGWRGAAVDLKEADERERKRRTEESIASEMQNQATVPSLDGTHTVETRDTTRQERRTDVEREMRDTDTRRRTVFDFVYSSQATRTEVSLLNHPKPEEFSSASSLSPQSSRCSRSSVSPSSTSVSPASEAFMRLPETAFAVLCGFLCGDLLPLLQTCRYLRSAVLSTFGTCQQQLNLLMVDVDDTHFPSFSPAPTPLSPASPSSSVSPVSRDVSRAPSASFASSPFSFSSFRFTHLAQAFKKDKTQLLYLLTFWRGAVEAWVEPRQLAELLECMDSLENIRELSLFSDERMHVFFSQEDPESASVFEAALDMSEEDRESRRRKSRRRRERQDGKKKGNPFVHLKLRRKKQRSPNTLGVDVSEEGEARRGREDVGVTRRRRQSDCEEKGIRTESEKSILAFSSTDTQATNPLQAGAPFTGVFENSSGVPSNSCDTRDRDPTFYVRRATSPTPERPQSPRLPTQSTRGFSGSTPNLSASSRHPTASWRRRLSDVQPHLQQPRPTPASTSVSSPSSSLPVASLSHSRCALPSSSSFAGSSACGPLYGQQAVEACLSTLVSLCARSSRTLEAFYSSVKLLNFLSLSAVGRIPVLLLPRLVTVEGTPATVPPFVSSSLRFVSLCGTETLRADPLEPSRGAVEPQTAVGGRAGAPCAAGACGDWPASLASGRERKQEGEEERRGEEQEAEKEEGLRRKEEQEEDEHGEGERGDDRDKDLGGEVEGTRVEVVKREASVSRNVERKGKIASRRSDAKSASDAELHREVEEAPQEAGRECEGVPAFPFQGGTDVSCWAVHEPYLCLSIWRSQPTLTTILCEGLTLRVPDSECARWDLSLRHPPARSVEKLGSERDRTTLPGKGSGRWQARDVKLGRDGEREWPQDTVKAMHATHSEETYTLSLPYPFPSSGESKNPRLVLRSGGLRSRPGYLVPERECLEVPWSLVHPKTPSRSFLTRSQSPSSITKPLASWAPSLCRWAPSVSSGAPNLSLGPTELAVGSRVFSLPSLSRMRLRAVSECSLILPKLEAATFAIEGHVCLLSRASRAHSGARSRGEGGALGPVVLELLGAAANSRFSTNSFYWGSVEAEMETRDEETRDEEAKAEEPHKETDGEETHKVTQGEASPTSVDFDTPAGEVEVAVDRIGERGVACDAQRRARHLVVERRGIRESRKRDDDSRTGEKTPHPTKLETSASATHNFQGWLAGRKQPRNCVCHSRSVGESPSLDLLECTGSRLVLASSSPSSWSNMASVSLQLPLCLLHITCSLFDATVTSTERVAAVLVAPVDGDSSAFTGATLQKFFFRQEPKGPARKATRLEIADTESLTGDRIGLRTLARARNTSDREKETETEEGEEEEKEEEEEEEEEKEEEGTREERERGGKGGVREQWVLSGEREPEEKQSRVRACGRLPRGVSWRRTTARQRSSGEPPKRTGRETSGEEAPGRSTGQKRKKKEEMHREESVEGTHRSRAIPEWEHIAFKGTIATGGLPCLRCRACKGERQLHRCIYREKLLPQDIVDLLSSAASSCSFHDIHLDSLMWCTYPPLCSPSSVSSASCPSSRRGSSVPASSRLMTVREMRRRRRHFSLSPSERFSPDGSSFHSPAVSVTLSPSSTSLLSSPPSSAVRAPCSGARHHASRCPPASGFRASSSPFSCVASPASSPGSLPSGNTLVSPRLSQNPPSFSSVSSSAASLSPHLLSSEAFSAAFPTLAVGCTDTPVHAQHSRAVSTSLFPIAADTSLRLNVPREVHADAAAENVTTCICTLSFDPFPSCSGLPASVTPRRVDEAPAGSSSSPSVSSASSFSLAWHLTRPESSRHDAELAHARDVCAQHWRCFWREVEKRVRQTHRVQCHRTGVATVSADCMRLRKR